MRHIKLLVWLIFILSGASALIYEVIWMRQLTLVFGSTVFATSTVLTAFMAGLALGSFYFGRKIDEGRMSPLKLYALLEVGIGGFCIIWPLLLTVLTGLYVLIYRNITSEFYTLSLIRFVLTFGILLIPSTLMGGTLPVLTRFFVKRLEQLGTNIGILYALNTFGAVIGTVAAGFFLIQALGITWTLRVGIAINLGVALVALVLARHAHKIETDENEESIEQTESVAGEQEAAVPEVVKQERQLVLWAIGISGFCALAYEVLWTRILVFFLGSTTYAFATMLAAFLFGIALGSIVLARWVDKIKQPVTIFGIVQLGIGLFAIALMPAFERLYGMTYALQSTFGSSRFWAFFSCFVVMSLPTFLMGASFPLVTKIYTGNARQLGRSIGNVYAINTVGSILGAFCAGFLLIPLLGIRPSIVLTVALNTGIGCLLVLKGLRTSKDAEIGETESGSGAKSIFQGMGIAVPILNIGLAVILLLTLSQPLFKKSTIYKTQRPGDEVVDYKEEVDATVTTLKDDEGIYRLYVDANQAADASRWDSPSHRVIAHLPLLLHPNPKRALVVGFGMGLTSHSITQHGVQVDAIELSKGVISAAQEHFKHVNGNIFENRLFNYKINDGRNHILMTQTKYEQTKYDMISTGIIHPLVSAGSSNIYTEDFYKLCKRILTEGGVMCQWVPLHRLPEAHYKMIVRTFINVFPETTLWYKYTPDFVILIGTRKRLSIDYEDFMARCRIPSIREGLAADDLDGMSLLDSFMMGPRAVREYASDGPIHTDDRPRLEFFKGEDLVSSTAKNIEGMKEYRQHVTPFLRNYGATWEEKKAVQEKIATYFNATQKLILGQIAYAKAQIANPAAQLEKASTLMNEAVRDNPIDETIRYNFGVVSGFINEGYQEELRQLEKEAQQNMRQNPGDVQVHLQLATVYERYASEYENLAMQYERKGELEKATTELEKATTELAKASTELEKLLKRDPSRSEVYPILGALYERQERYKEALRTYERWEQREPDLPEIIFAAMARLHLVLNNLDEAKKYAQKGVDADENAWRSFYILGNVYAAMNQPQKQQEYFTTALKNIDRAIPYTSDLTNLQFAKQQIQNELKEIQK
ncbi:fused MFS/spermidine synthase [Candidatus Poribacteria bacterium]|nr:fused MFS/spermidine synthase [Candidatus Poribacteria bacterium]